MSWPDLMPAAESVAAVVAASPRPKAVPRTAVVAEFIMDSMSCTSWPKPASFFFALSIARARSKPPCTAIPATAATPAPATLPITPTSSDAFVRTAFHARDTPPTAALETLCQLFCAFVFSLSQLEDTEDSILPASLDVCCEVLPTLCFSCSVAALASSIPFTKRELSTVIFALRV